MKVAVARTAFEEIRPRVGIANYEITSSDVFETHVKFKQAPIAGRNAALHDGAIGPGKAGFLDFDAACQEGLIDDKVWQGCGGSYDSDADKAT